MVQTYADLFQLGYIKILDWVKLEQKLQYRAR